MELEYDAKLKDSLSSKLSIPTINDTYRTVLFPATKTKLKHISLHFFKKLAVILAFTLLVNNDDIDIILTNTH